jgi:hypothetical protein
MDRAAHAFEWLEDDVLLITLRGHEDARAIETATTDLDRFLGERRVRFVLFDVEGVTSFSPNVADAGRLLLQKLKASGAEISFAWSSNTPLRMMGQTLAFAARLSLRFVASRDEARAQVRQRRLIR